MTHGDHDRGFVIRRKFKELIHYVCPFYFKTYSMYMYNNYKDRVIVHLHGVNVVLFRFKVFHLNLTSYTSVIPLFVRCIIWYACLLICDVQWGFINTDLVSPWYNGSYKQERLNIYVTFTFWHHLCGHGKFLYSFIFHHRTALLNEQFA